jgi:hypothetical protein
LKSSLAEARRDRSVADESAKSAQSDLAERVSSVADRLEMLNQRFGIELEVPARAKRR